MAKRDKRRRKQRRRARQKELALLIEKTNFPLRSKFSNERNDKTDQEAPE